LRGHLDPWGMPCTRCPGPIQRRTRPEPGAAATPVAQVGIPDRRWDGTAATSPILTNSPSSVRAYGGDASVAPSRGQGPARMAPCHAGLAIDERVGRRMLSRLRAARAGGAPEHPGQAALQAGRVVTLESACP